MKRFTPEFLLLGILLVTTRLAVAEPPIGSEAAPAPNAAADGSATADDSPSAAAPDVQSADGEAAQPTSSATAPAQPAQPSDAAQPTSGSRPADSAPPAVAPAAAPAAAANAGGSPAADGEQGPGEALFAEKCGSCHSVGKGDRVGPDLKGAHERRDPAWLKTMIQKPSALLGSDPDARELLKKYNNVRMPDLGLSDQEVAALTEVIARCSTQTCNLAGQFTPVTDATAADVERGRMLFVGEEPLVAGGPPCVSCHTARGIKAVIAGGTLAKDLTHVFARLGDEGLDGALKNPSFDLMKDIYADKKLDKDEAFALRAFLSASNRATDDGDSLSVFVAAVVGTGVCLLILNLFWRRRLLGVREPMVRSQGVAS